ncbi:MAG: hypothetical protein P9X24_11560 [Candidatus Hatepunaea meridiana]|nr:hypothetical protein [Candidatus Hatepunaea meridiana]
MKRKKNNISVKRGFVNASDHTGCPEWSSKLPHLTSLSHDDPERIEWEQHAEDCRECKVVLQQELDLVRSLTVIHDPSPARISYSVMRKIRQRKETSIKVRPREVSWGLAGSLAGVLLGIWLAGVVPNGSTIAATNSSTEEFVAFEDTIDQLIWEMSSISDNDVSEVIK